jgi:adenylosuccinate lyase
VIACSSLLNGLAKLQLNREIITEDLDRSWEVLAEPIQTVMRSYGVANPYEQLKALTRGRKVTADTLVKFIQSLDIPVEARQKLLELTPATYTGNAEAMARFIDRES